MAETYKMIALSTAHISKETCKMMEDPISNESLYCSVSIYPKDQGDAFGCVGFFVPIVRFKYEDPDCYEGSIPEDLAACIKYAISYDADWLMFDRDAEIVPELPEYCWD